MVQLSGLSVTASPLTQGSLSSGSFTDSAGNMFTKFIRLTANNAQSKDTPKKFPQLIQIPLLPGMNSNWSNVSFTQGSSTELYSWIESQGSSSTNASIWVLLPEGIPANTAMEIYVWVAKTSVTWDSFRGEAPQLSLTYGANDTGNMIFPFYANFAGTTLDTSTWQTILGGGSVSQNNGITISCGNSAYAILLSKNTFTYPLIAEGLYKVNNSTGEPQYTGPGESLSASNSGTYLSAELDSSYFFNLQSSDIASSLSVINSTGGGTSVGSSISQPLPAIVGTQWEATGSEYGLINDGYPAGVSGTDTTLAIADYYLLVGGMGTGGAGAGNMTVQWYRGRIPPPNNVMPYIASDYPLSLSGYTDAGGNISLPLIQGNSYKVSFSGPNVISGDIPSLLAFNQTIILYKITNNTAANHTITIGGQSVDYGSSIYLRGGKGVNISVSDPSFVEWLPSSAFMDSSQSSTSLISDLTTDLMINYSYQATKTVDITTTQNYTVPSGETITQVNMWGGGGGAGSVSDSGGTAPIYESSGGAGSGGNLVFTSSIPAGTVIPVTIGGGGAGGYIGSSESGGNTVFGTSGDSYYAIAGGGSASPDISTNGTNGAAGAGGTNTIPTQGTITTNTSYGGGGGNGFNGNGGGGGGSSSNGGGGSTGGGIWSGHPNGYDASPYGSGGGGAVVQGSPTSAAGGNGSQGIVILTVFYVAS